MIHPHSLVIAVATVLGAFTISDVIAAKAEIFTAEDGSKLIVVGGKIYYPSGKGGAPAGKPVDTKEEKTKETASDGVAKKDTESDEDKNVKSKLLAAPFANDSLHMNLGVVMSSPYKTKFTPATKDKASKLELDRSGSKDANAYLEFVYDNHWAWSSAGKRPGGPKPAETQSIFDSFQGKNTNRASKACLDPIISPNWDLIDMQVRLGYTYAQDNNKVSGIVGTGEFDAEVSIEPILLRRFCEDGTKWSINSVFSYGGTTDRVSFDIHHRYFVGLAWYASPKLALLSDSENSHAFMMVRLGAANTEIPTFLDEDSNLLRTNHGEDVPSYHSHWGLALESEFYVPINETTSLVGGGRLYGNSDPNNWMLFLGVSMSPKEVTKRIGGLIDSK